jgi:hypothetical protein
VHWGIAVVPMAAANMTAAVRVKTVGIVDLFVPFYLSL